MGVYKYTGKKEPVYFVDYYFKGKRIRDGKFRESPMRAVYFEELADDYDKQARTWKSCHNEKYCIGSVRACFKGTPRRAKKPRGEAAVNREMAWLRAMPGKAVKWELIPKIFVGIWPEIREGTRSCCVLFP